MKVRQIVKTLLVLSSVLAFLGLVPTARAQPGVPPLAPANPITPLQQFQAQTHFLVFLGKDTAGENKDTARAYYDAIDPNKQNRTFQDWLVNTGFIGDKTQWNATGPQIVACDLGKAAGCDVPKHNPDGTPHYGYGVINADSHAIVLNAADLGFVRNQYVRCVPNCDPKNNPIVYTYLENYPVNPFASSAIGGSGFPTNSGYPLPNEAASAIASALNRPAGVTLTNKAGKKLQGQLLGCDPDKTKDTLFGCKISRIADVAFEWAPPPTNLQSSTRYGQLYAFLYNDADPNNILETIANPTAGSTPNVATGQLEPFGVGDPFPPNLDFQGNKQHPGVCFICHGGKPQKLTSTGAYPNQGNVNGFRLLPLDIPNLLFTSDSGGEQPASNGSVAFTDRLHQELQIKLYNLAVLLTVPTTTENDGTGATRVAALREVIQGWYAGGRTTQDAEFTPVAWRDATSNPPGTAPPGSTVLYHTVVSPSCRSCHFNREISLDFGTPANFKQESDLLQLALLPDCSVLRPNDYSPDPKAKFMPLAYLTFQRFYQANLHGQVLPFPSPGINLFNTVEKLANYFGFSGTSGYCATNP